MNDKQKQILQNIKAIINYCTKYQEWLRKYQNPQTAKEKESQRLYKWLQRHNFFAENKPFTYQGIKDENGTLIVDILNNLRQEYPLKPNYTYVFDLVQEIKIYCETYKEWPKLVYKPTTPKQIASNRHAYWLNKVHYKDDKEEFKYTTLKDEKGQLLIATLDALYAKYYKAPQTLEEKAEAMVNELINYCETFNKWPHLYPKPKNPQEVKANQIYQWLAKHNALSDSKACPFSSVKNQEGVLLLDIINNLRNQYSFVNRSFPTIQEEHVIAITNDIINYCLTYHEWPTATKKPQTKKEELSNRLDYWIDRSHFYSPEKFKYNHIFYYKHIRVYDILLLYYATFGYAKRKTNFYTKLENELKEDTIFLLYNCIIKLFQYATTSYEGYLSYLKKIENILSNISLNITLKEIIEYLKLSKEELETTFYQKYCIYSLANDNSLAYLYHLLYIAFLPQSSRIRVKA